MLLRKLCSDCYIINAQGTVADVVGLTAEGGLIANCIMLQNVIDITNICHELQKEGYTFSAEDLSHLSPYMTEHIKRFGEYILDLIKKPENLSQIRDKALFDLANASSEHISWLGAYSGSLLLIPEKMIIFFIFNKEV